MRSAAFFVLAVFAAVGIKHMAGQSSPQLNALTQIRGLAGVSQQPSFLLSIQGPTLTMGSGGIYTPSGIIPIIGLFTITSNNVASDSGSVQVGINEAGNPACFYQGINIADFTVAGFINQGLGNPCYPGPDAATYEYMQTVNVNAGVFSLTAVSQFIPLTMPWACFGITPTFPAGSN